MVRTRTTDAHWFLFRNGHRWSRAHIGTYIHRDCPRCMWHHFCMVPIDTVAQCRPHNFCHHTVWCNDIRIRLDVKCIGHAACTARLCNNQRASVWEHPDWYRRLAPTGMDQTAPLADALSWCWISIQDRLAYIRSTWCPESIRSLHCVSLGLSRRTVCTLSWLEILWIMFIDDILLLLLKNKDSLLCSLQIIFVFRSMIKFKLPCWYRNSIVCQLLSSSWPGMRISSRTFGATSETVTASALTETNNIWPP